jgi:hypothetical protein
MVEILINILHDLCSYLQLSLTMTSDVIKIRPIMVIATT